MRDYGTIARSFWTSDDIKALSEQARYFATYLLTGPHTTQIGCFRLPVGYAMADLGWDESTTRARLAELAAAGFIRHEPATGWLCIVNFLRWNPIENPNQAKAAAKLFDQLPTSGPARGWMATVFRAHAPRVDCGVYEAFFRQVETVPEPFRKGFETVPERSPEPFRNQEQEQEQEQHHKQEQQDPPSPRSGGVAVEGSHPSATDAEPPVPRLPHAEELPDPPSGAASSRRAESPPELGLRDLGAVVSAEDRLWAMAPDLEGAGVRRSQIGKLIKLTDDDFDRCADIVEATLKARSPRNYIGGVIRNLQHETGEAGPAPPRPGADDTPEWVRRERAGGGYVAVDRDVTARKGERMWRWNGELFDDEGNRNGW